MNPFNYVGVAVEYIVVDKLELPVLNRVVGEGIRAARRVAQADVGTLPIVANEGRLAGKAALDIDLVLLGVDIPQVKIG